MMEKFDLETNFTPFLAKNFSTINRDWSHFPGIAYTFAFEEYLLDRLEPMRRFVTGNYLFPLVICSTYCVSLPCIARWMSTRKPFQLRLPLIVWNFALAIFSLFGSVRVLPEVWWMLSTRGLFASTCDHRFIDDARIFLWIYLFTFSKVFEFGDTLFILLRKQRLLPLHWIHHAWTHLYSWYSLFAIPAHSRWHCGMNFAVHTVMYSYYAVMASGVRVRRSTAFTITTLQIAQMTFGVYTQIQALWFGDRARGGQCDVSLPNAAFGFSMYFTYWILFIKFFVDKYCRKTTKMIPSTKKD